MRIAIPTLKGSFCEHFGQADGFYLCDVTADHAIDRPRQVVRPKGECEQVPQWLKDMAVTAVIAGSIGQVAQQHLARLHILVVPGQRGDCAADVARAYLQGQASPRTNRCQTAQHQSLHCRKKHAR